MTMIACTGLEYCSCALCVRTRERDEAMRRVDQVANEMGHAAAEMKVHLDAALEKAGRLEQQMDEAALLLGESGTKEGKREKTFHSRVVQWLDRNGYDICSGEQRGSDDQDAG